MPSGFPEPEAAEWSVRTRRKLSCSVYYPSHVGSGRLCSFPVQGAFLLRATSAARTEHSVSFRGTFPVPGLRCDLPHLRSLLQIEILSPVATPLAGTARLCRLHRRRGFGPTRHVAHGHRQVPFAIPHRQRSIQPFFYPHVGPTQPTDDRRPVDLIQLGIEADGVIVPHLPRFHMAQRGRQMVALVQRTMRIVGVGRFHRQLPLPPHHIVLLEVLAVSYTHLTLPTNREV